MEIENQMITLDKINKAWGFDINHYPKDNLTFVHARRDIDAEFADEVEGLDKESLLACFDEQRTISVVEADQNEAQALGLSSTPTFLVNGALIAGAVPLEEMTTYIDLALKDAEEK